MKFKNALAESDFKIMPKKLLELATDFETYSLFFGIEPTVTRIREPFPGDSGVHEQGRGIDFRDSVFQQDGSTKRTYTLDQVDSLINIINTRHARDDSKPTIMHHSFQGGPAHFHIQIPAAWLEPGEPLPRA